RMQRISFAPVLSATLSRDSCWIICYLLVVSPVPGLPGLARTRVFIPDLSDSVGTSATTQSSDSELLLGLLEDLNEAPALGGGQRTGLHDPDPVADAGAVALVVSLHPTGLAQHLAVQAVLHP